MHSAGLERGSWLYIRELQHARLLSTTGKISPQRATKFKRVVYATSIIVIKIRLCSIANILSFFSTIFLIVNVRFVLILTKKKTQCLVCHNSRDIRRTFLFLCLPEKNIFNIILVNTLQTYEVLSISENPWTFCKRIADTRTEPVSSVGVSITLI